MVTSQNGTSPEHTITALVQDKPGVLNRITSMFRRRGYNIASLAVGPSEIPDLSRMTFVVEGDARTIEQVSKNLNKLIDVIKVVDVDDDNSVWRELALVRVKWNTLPLSEIKAIVDVFGAKIVDTAPESLIIEVTGKSNKVNDLVDNLEGFGFQIQEVMRTGVVAMSRGSSEGESRRRVRVERPAVKWESGSV